MPQMHLKTRTAVLNMIRCRTGSHAVKFLKYWQDVVELTGFSDKTSGGVLKTLQLVTWLATHTN